MQRLNALYRRAVPLLAIVGCTTESVETSTGEQALTGTTCVELVAVADALLANPPMNHNFGAMPVMRVGGKHVALVRFDLDSIPSSAVVTTASMKLYISGSESTAPVNAHRVVSAWSEGSVTYASFGQQYDPSILGAIQATSANAQKSIELTSQVKSWITHDQPNYGVLLETGSIQKTIFVSREGGTSMQKPRLEVCYTVPADHCSPNPCENGASCDNGLTSFTCQCAPGFIGTTCATPIETCASDPCRNGGTCTDGVDDYTCACPLGFTGTNCELVIDYCADSPCQNGGVCGNGNGIYICQCPPDYEGTDCESRIDNCAAQPCLNNGICASEGTGYTCTCADGFSGASCEIDIDDCVNAPCHNGGTCVDGTSAYTCACPPDWGGASCDINLKSCSQNPCLNGSTCSNGYGTYTCTCAAGYSGANCEIDVNDCAPSPCEHGGACIDGVDSYACTCAVGYSGTTCETQTSTCSSATLLFDQSVSGAVSAQVSDVISEGGSHWYYINAIDANQACFWPVEEFGTLGIFLESVSSDYDLYVSKMEPDCSNLRAIGSSRNGGGVRDQVQFRESCADDDAGYYVIEVRLFSSPLTATPYFLTVDARL